MNRNYFDDNNMINTLKTKVKEKVELFSETSKEILWGIIILNIIFLVYSLYYLSGKNKTFFGVITMFLLAIYSLVIFTYAVKTLGFINEIPWEI
jgi:hypothetical protein